MLVSDDAALIWYFHFDDRIIFQNDALATQAGFQFWIDGPVHEIFFLVRNFLQKIIAFENINMAGAARTNAATIVVQVNAMFFGYFQDGHVNWHVGDRNGRNAFIFESKFDGCHNLEKSANVEFV